MNTLDSLVAGFGRFRQHFCLGRRDDYERLLDGQAPGAMVIACCDSRVDPALLMECEPGDIFVHRSIAALVPPESPSHSVDCTMAATAYAVMSLGVEELIVIGHTACGGISALVEGDHGVCEGHLGPWLNIGRPVLEQAKKKLPFATEHELRDECERLAPIYSCKNLLSYPWIKERVDAKDLGLHAWLFDLRSGELLGYDFTLEKYIILRKAHPSY